MKIDFFFLIIIALFVLYTLIKSKCKISEGMADVALTDQMNQAINQAVTKAVKDIYLADVEAIRTLSNTANQLQKGGITIPGNATISGDATISGNTNINGNTTIKGALTLPNEMAHPDNVDGAIYRSEGQLQIAVDDLVRLRNMSSKDTGIQLDTRKGLGDIANPNGQLKLSRSGIMFGGTNDGREANSAVISVGQFVQDSLCILGMAANKDPNTRKIDMWAEKGLNVYGPIIANSRNILAELDELKAKCQNIVLNGDASRTTFRNDVYAVGYVKSQSGRLYMGDMWIGQDNPISVWGGPAGGGMHIQTG